VYFPFYGKVFKLRFGLVNVPSVADLVKCVVHGYFRRSGNVAKKYGASSVEYGLTFTQLMRCLNTRSVSTVKRLVNETVGAGLVKPVDVGVFGRRVVYRPTLRGVVYAAIDEVFFGSPKLADLVVGEVVKWLEGSCSGVDGGGDGREACDCLKYKLAKLVGKVLSGSEAGLKVADFNIADAVYYLLFSRIGDLLVVRYASAIVNDIGDPVRDAVEDYVEWTSGGRGLVRGGEWCRAMLNVLHDWFD
jgi:hypothetical protein